MIDTCSLVREDFPLICSFDHPLDSVSEASHKIFSSEIFSNAISTYSDISELSQNLQTRIIANITLRTELCTKLQEIVLKIHDLVEMYRGQGEFKMEFDPLNAVLNKHARLQENGVFVVPPEILNPIIMGISGTYFLLDREMMALAVIKPLDEEYGCINNPKGFNTLRLDSPARAYIPLYQSALKEALTYQFAKVLSVESIAPQTSLAVLRSEGFFDFRDHPEITLVQSLKSLELFSECEPLLREKLCSVQEFIPNSETLLKLIKKTVKQFNLKQFENLNQRIIEQFDQQQFEDLNILIWAIYDTDAHSENIMTFVLRYDKNGQEVYGLKKIDNGLAFPEKNKAFWNDLMLLPNANYPLSLEGKQKLLTADVEALTQKMREYGLEKSIPAFRERIALLKKLALKPNITIEEINQELEKLGKECKHVDRLCSCSYSYNIASNS